ncbi:MAG: hypothetical protein ACRC14_08590, partial [Paracoccaceae bacterium]
GTLNALGFSTGVTIVNGTDVQVEQHIIEFQDEITVKQTMFKSKPWPEALAPWTSRAADPAGDGLPYPADRSRALRGIKAPGYRSGSFVTVQGTSFSTALASRDALKRLVGVYGPPA